MAGMDLHKTTEPPPLPLNALDLWHERRWIETDDATLIGLWQAAYPNVEHTCVRCDSIDWSRMTYLNATRRECIAFSRNDHTLTAEASLEEMATEVPYERDPWECQRCGMPASRALNELLHNLNKEPF